MSEQPKWTPGPWEFNGPGSCGWVHVMGHPTPKTSWCIATCTNARMDTDGSKFAGVQQEAEANARLIAAAPELYEALAEVVRDWEADQVNNRDLYFRSVELLKTARGDA